MLLKGLRDCQGTRVQMPIQLEDVRGWLRESACGGETGQDCGLRASCTY